MKKERERKKEKESVEPVRFMLYKHLDFDPEINQNRY